MSYLDAKRDNIPTQQDSHGYTWYYPPCWVCGAAVPSWNYLAGTKYTCDKCRKIMALEKTAMSADKKQAKLKTAIKRISKVANIAEYENAIRIVTRKLGTPRWFQSTEEIMVALELISKKIPTHHQVKIYDYYVDFVIPKFKVALEVDGKPFHAYKNKAEAEIRDELVADKLGPGWQVIHIDTVNINTNITKLLPAIKAVRNFRNKTW